MLLDWIMPNMNGHETLLGMRQIQPEVPILLTSGFTADTLPPGLVDHEWTGFLKKPYRPGELLDQLRPLLDQLSDRGSPESRSE